MIISSGKLALLVAAIILSTGCTTARIRHFQQLADAGTAYATAVDSLLDEAGAAAIDADSALLMSSRDGLDRAARSRNLVEQNKLLKERLHILDDLKRHAALLRRYFEALGRLAGSNREAAMGRSTKGIMKELNDLNPQIRSARVGASSIGDLLGSVLQITVVRVRSKALAAELQERGPAIERELALQEAALTLIARQMKVDLQAENQLAETQDVVIPFAQQGNLPGSWKNRRRDVLRASLALRSADAAVSASKKLRTSFAALVEGRYDASDLGSMLVDVNRVVDLVELVKGEDR